MAPLQSKFQTLLTLSPFLRIKRFIKIIFATLSGNVKIPLLIMSIIYVIIQRFLFHNYFNLIVSLLFPRVKKLC